MSYEEVEKSQKVEVKNVNNDDLIDINEHLCFNALGLIGKRRENPIALILINIIISNVYLLHIFRFL